ncbi:hypothetical protein PG984_014534 [Apiospora sp. TS-2023a]
MAALKCTLSPTATDLTQLFVDALVRRLREALVKAVTLKGVRKPLQAACAVSVAESPEDKDYTVWSAGWQSYIDAAHARGRQFYGRLHGPNVTDTAGLLAGHHDFDDDLQVEAAIMSQDLERETGWHLRGIRRLGASRADVKVLWDAVRLVGGFALWAGSGQASHGG